MSKENILRLEIAMNDFVLLQQHQTAQKLLSESSNNLQRETAEGVGLDKLVEIHIEELSRDAEVATEIKALNELDHAVFVLRIL